MTTLRAGFRACWVNRAARSLLHQRAAHAAGKMHALAFHVGAGRLPDLERFGIVAEVDPDLLENGIGVVLHEREAFLAQHLVIRNLARDVRDGGGRAGGTRGAFRVSAAGTPSGTGCRLWLLHRRSRLARCRSNPAVWSQRPSVADQFASWTCLGAPFPASEIKARRARGGAGTAARDRHAARSRAIPPPARRWSAPWRARRSRPARQARALARDPRTRVCRHTAP